LDLKAIPFNRRQRRVDARCREPGASPSKKFDNPKFFVILAALRRPVNAARVVFAGVRCTCARISRKESFSALGCGLVPEKMLTT